MCKAIDNRHKNIQTVADVWHEDNAGWLPEYCIARYACS